MSVVAPLALFVAFTVVLLANSIAVGQTLTYDIPHIENFTVDNDFNSWGDSGLKINQLATISGTVQDPSVFGSQVRLAWNSEGLLIAVNVVDSDTTESDDTSSLYAQNSVELFMSPFPKSWDIAQVSISPGMDPNHPTLRYHWNDRRTTPALAKVPLLCEIKATKTSTGYVLTALWPWTNLGINPQVGSEFSFQVHVNDNHQGQYTSLGWFPTGGTYQDSSLMNVVRLADSPSHPIDAAATGSYVDPKHAQVSVVAVPSLVNHVVTVVGCGQELAKAPLVASGGNATANLTFTPPGIDKKYGPFTVLVDNQPFTRLDFGDYRNLRFQLLKQQPITLTSPDFTGTTLPALDFVNPSAVQQIFGPYSLKATYYDSNYNVVTEANQPGRYGVVFTVKTAWGDELTRDYTLIRDADANNPPVVIDRSQDDDWWAGLKSLLPDDPIYPYYTHLPEGYKSNSGPSWPLLVFLHGSGDGNADPSFFDVHGPNMVYANGGKLPFVVICPQLSAGQHYWSTTMVAAFLRKIESKYRIDRDRVYLTGLSLGGIGTWSFAEAHPEMVAAVAPVSGFGDPSQVAKIGKLPVWAFHGSADGNVPLQRDMDTITALELAGGDAKITVFPGLSHFETWPPAFSDMQLYSWMLTHRISDRN